jgi:predicted flap endonuclease-1-like 5' DNA nuclease
MNYPVTELDKITPGIGGILKANKIRTTNRLLEEAKTPKKRLTLAKQTGLSVGEVLRCATMADRLRIKGIGRDHAELLECAGVKTVQDLRYRNPENLAEAMAKAIKTAKLRGPPPSVKVVTRWIEQAKKLKVEMTY